MIYISELIGTKHPIIQGGMGNISHPSLAIAVSEAGGLGTIGAGTMDPSIVEDMIQKIKANTSKPFAVNLPISVHPECKKIIDLIISYQVPVVTLSAGNPTPFIDVLKRNGCIVMCVVANEKQAKKAEKQGADLIIAEGYEAAGINSSEELTTFTLIPKITSSVSIPVIAAGGIGDGRGLLAAMALGASGVQLGTRLIATKEAQVHSSYKEALLTATSLDTIIVGRTHNKIRRVLKTPYTRELAKKEATLTRAEYDELTDEIHHTRSAIEGNLNEGHLNAGQVASMIQDIPSVKELLERMLEEARQIYRENFPL
ncbi:nitronate monooxygenase [Halobacillus rhizosphaerae]|uniref:NAD(P)H-dependent flavin oxidoreductase n=1 Tax=Halobacillus rhizosphaerae TaxID=3064889 RepID=UPI00398B808C